MKIDITIHQWQRYQRQITIDRFGYSGQKKLRNAGVLIAGVGGLGSVAALYLAAAGIGRMGLVDHDRVELTNLNRQILYRTEDIGKKKAAVAAARIKNFNPEVEVLSIHQSITESDALQMVHGYDVIVDAMDNFFTRYILNKVSQKNNIPLFHGAVEGFEGRATTIVPGKTPCLRCIYPKSPPPEQTQTSVVGATAAVIGSIQATEAVKYIIGLGKLLTGRLMVYDGLSMEFMMVPLKKRTRCQECSHISED